MTQRRLFIAAYDVSEPRRLREALRVLRNYSTGGQKSVFECYLSAAETVALVAQMKAVIDLDEDRFVLLRLDPRSKVRTLGIALKPVDPGFFFIG
jgi:CRISPR-associated protein Cas2